MQADCIEQVLASHRVPAEVAGGVVTPAVVRFEVRLPLGVRVGQVARLAEELALALGVSSCRVYREGGAVQVEVPRQSTALVSLTSLCRRLGQVPPCTAVLGLESTGAPLLLRLTSPEVAHVLVAGTTGSGKTALVRAMVLSLAWFNRPSALQVVIIDPKGRGQTLSRLPHVLGPVLRTVEEVAEGLREVVKEMERRDAEKGWGGWGWPELVVVVDELAEWLVVGGEAVREPLVRLVQRGREAGVHVIGCTQHPTAGVLGSAMLANFPVRLVGRVVSATEARVAAGVGGSGAERLRGRGDFVAVAGGQVRRFQAAWAGVKEVEEVVARWSKGEERSWGWMRLAEAGRRLLVGARR